MRKLLGALALISLCSITTGAIAQSQSRLTPLEWYVSDEGFRNARLSPDGRYVIAIQMDSEGDTLIRLDWRTQQAVALQRVVRGEARNQIDWAEWKGNDRLVMSVTTTRPATVR